MRKSEEFPFDRARRMLPGEIKAFRKAYENTFGKKPPRRGRPPKAGAHKYKDIHIKLHPRALKWAQAEAKRRGVGYQTVINDLLLGQAA